MKITDAAPETITVPVTLATNAAETVPAAGVFVVPAAAAENDPATLPDAATFVTAVMDPR